MQRGSREVAQVAPDYPFAETAIIDRPEYPKLSFVEESYSHDTTNWWIPNRAAVEAMLRSSGFSITAHPEEEVYMCTVSEVPWAEHHEARVPGQVQAQLGAGGRS